MDWSSSTTRMSAMKYPGRQRDPGSRALRLDRCQLDGAVVALHDRLRVYQPKTHAVPLGRHERIEDALANLRIDSGAGVADVENHPGPAIDGLGDDPQRAPGR